MARAGDDEAVSVIVGTLLLILVAVFAAAGLAIMVAQLQKDEMDRQSHIAAVESEEIVIQGPVLVNDRAAWNQSPFNITLNQTWTNWSSVTFTLANRNTDDVNIVGVAVNDRYSRNFTVVNGLLFPSESPYNISDRDYLTIPGTESRTVRVNFTVDFPAPQYIGEGEQVRINVITSSNNVFARSLRPPVPVPLVRIETEDLGAMERHVILLDGSGSTGDNGMSGWNWTVIGGEETIPLPGTWSDTSNVSTAFLQGKTVRFTPGETGPFRASLTVTDTAGMSRTSEPVGIPADRDFVPVANVFAARINSSVLSHDIVNVTVKDLNGNPVPGVTVNFAVGSNPYNTLLFGPFYNTTGTDGVATTEVFAGNGTIKAVCGKFPVMDVPVGL